MWEITEQRQRAAGPREMVTFKRGRNPKWHIGCKAGRERRGFGAYPEGVVGSVIRRLEGKCNQCLKRPVCVVTVRRE